MSSQTPLERAGLRANRSVPASPEAVFRLWTDPQHIRRWLGGPSVEVRRAEVDLKVGGRYSFELVNPDGSTSTITGVYLQVEPPLRLVYTWIIENDEGRTPETRVEVEFIDRGEATEIALLHTGFPSAQLRDEHRAGWEACFDELSELIA